MSEELTQEDWKQIALFYQNKFNELELNVLGMELKLQKAQQAAAQSQSSETTDD